MVTCLARRMNNSLSSLNALLQSSDIESLPERFKTNLKAIQSELSSGNENDSAGSRDQNVCNGTMVEIRADSDSDSHLLKTGEKRRAEEESSDSTPHLKRSRKDDVYRGNAISANFLNGTVIFLQLILFSGFSVSRDNIQQYLCHIDRRVHAYLRDSRVKYRVKVIPNYKKAQLETLVPLYDSFMTSFQVANR